MKKELINIFRKASLNEKLSLIQEYGEYFSTIRTTSVVYSLYIFGMELVEIACDHKDNVAEIIEVKDQTRLTLHIEAHNKAISF